MPAKLERCVQRLLKDKKFKPNTSSKERKSSAYAICTASVGNSNEITETILNLPPYIECHVDEKGFIRLSEVENFDFNAYDEENCKTIDAAALSELHFSEDEAGSNDFCSFAKFAEKDKDKDMDEEECSAVEMLRTGKFNHPWIGELSIERKMFSTMMENYLNDILSREIALDLEHKSDQGAYGWLKAVNMKRRKFNDGKVRDVLMGDWKLTEEGQALVDAGKYKYFSIEFAFNHIDKESEDEYGPTIQGGALTNRPFITKMKAVKMSEGATEAGADQPTSEGKSSEATTENSGEPEAQEENTEVKDHNQASEETTSIKEEENTDTANSESQTEPSEIKTVQASENKESPKKRTPFWKLSKGERKMNIEERIAKLREEYDALEDKTTDYAQKLSDEIEYLVTLSEEMKASKEEADTKLSETAAKLSEYEKSNQNIEARLAKIEQEKKDLEIQKFCDDMVREGHAPAVVKAVKNVLMGEGRGDEGTIRLSEGEGEKATHQDVDLRAALSHIVASIPKDSKVDGEEIITNKDTAKDEPEGEPEEGVLKASDGSEVKLFDEEAIKRRVKKAGHRTEA